MMQHPAYKAKARLSFRHRALDEAPQETGAMGRQCWPLGENAKCLASREKHAPGLRLHSAPRTAPIRSHGGELGSTVKSAVYGYSCTTRSSLKKVLDISTGAVSNYTAFHWSPPPVTRGHSPHEDSDTDSPYLSMNKVARGYRTEL